MTTTALQHLMTAGVPAILWGPPGVGKTALIEALARATSAHLETVILSVRDPADVGGYPVPPTDRGTGVALEPPTWAVRLARAAANGQPAILFLDELTTAPPAVQAAALRVVLDRAVGDLLMPRSVWCVAAANPPAQAAGAAADLPPPLANRFAHLDVEPRADAWAAGYPSYWAHAGGRAPEHPNPAAYERERARIAALVQRRPSLLCAVPEDAEAAGRAWPSPRSWDHTARALAAGASVETLAALVGEGAAAEYAAYRRHADLPDPADLVAGRASMPERDDAALAALLAVAAYTASHPDSIAAAADLILGQPEDVALVAARALADAVGLAAVPQRLVLRLSRTLRDIERDTGGES